MKLSCSYLKSQYGEKIQKIVNIQREEHKEAIFFIYQDGSTTDIIRGTRTNIDISKEREKRILQSGEIFASVHSHPTGFDPSTIDVMTGTVTDQEAMCVATPIHDLEIDDNYILTCLDLSELSKTQRNRLLRSMRRSSMGATALGRIIRKQINLQRFDVEGCRTHKLKVRGVEFPMMDRPSKFRLVIGEHTGVSGSLEDDEDIIG